MEGELRIIDVTLSTDTNAYANGDLLADTQVITGAFNRTDGLGVVESVTILDEDDQTAYALDVYFLDSSGSMGTENSAINVTDTVARSILGWVAFAATDMKDTVNSRVYYRTGLRVPVKAAAGTKDLYIAAAVLTGTPTHTATGLKARIAIRQD